MSTPYRSSSFEIRAVLHSGLLSSSNIVLTFHVVMVIFSFSCISNRCCEDQLAAVIKPRLGLTNAFFIPPFLGASHSGTGSSVPEEGCPVTHIAASVFLLIKFNNDCDHHVWAAYVQSS